MAGVYVGGGDPNDQIPTSEQLGGVLRAALVSAQRLLRERFENRVAWVDGHWQWRREKAGAGAEAPPLPAEARKKIDDVSRLFEILTNAQFRDRTPHPAHKPSPELVSGGPGAAYGHEQARLFGAGAARAGEAGAQAAGGEDSAFVMCALLLVAVIVVWVGAAVLLSRDTNRRRVKQLKQRINRWFSKKSDGSNGAADAEQAPPRDDPPPPYFDGSAEPFLPPGGAAGGPRAGGEDLPPPYSSCDAQPDCKLAPSNDQQQTLIDGVDTASAVSEIGDGCSAMSDVRGEAGKTDDEGCSKSDSGKAVLCDRSLVVVV